MDTVVQDIRHAIRRIRKSPGFAALTIGIMGLGIGANTAIFSIVDTVLFKPPPCRYPIGESRRLNDRRRWLMLSIAFRLSERKISFLHSFQVDSSSSSQSLEL